MKSSMKSLFKKYVIPVVLSFAVLGVAVFDTYPTYIKKTGVLSEIQCYEVATLVAVSASEAQGMSVPEGAKKALKDVARISKRVANYIVEKNPDLIKMPPSYLYSQVVQACIYSGGEYDLK